MKRKILETLTYGGFLSGMFLTFLVLGNEWSHYAEIKETEKIQSVKERTENEVSVNDFIVLIKPEPVLQPMVCFAEEKTVHEETTKPMAETVISETAVSEEQTTEAEFPEQVQEEITVCEVLEEQTEEIMEEVEEKMHTEPESIEPESCMVYEAEEAFVYQIPDSFVVTEGEAQTVKEYCGFKSFEPYTALTCTSSKQFQLQQYAVTDEEGFRKVNERYLVAVGSHFAMEIGQYFDLVLENGISIPCIVGDEKADIHTDEETHIFTIHSSCCSEFLVDKWQISDRIKQTGNVSFRSTTWDSPVVQFVVYSTCILLP